jgi:hypothetical protein
MIIFGWVCAQVTTEDVTLRLSTGHTFIPLATGLFTSPDLNPIENEWGLLKKRLYRDLPGSPAAIIASLHSMWLGLSQSYAEKLVFSMYNRCDRVIAQRGGRM